MLFVIGGRQEISPAGAVQVCFWRTERDTGKHPSLCFLIFFFIGCTACMSADAPPSCNEKRHGRQKSCPASLLAQSMCERLNVPCAVVALPKSIDNDLLLVRASCCSLWTCLHGMLELLASSWLFHVLVPCIPPAPAASHWDPASCLH